MDKLVADVSRKRPAYVPWLVKYLKIWFHGPVYEGVEGEVGESGELRFMGWPVKVDCCLLSEAMFTLGQKLNLTIEHVDGVRSKKGNLFDQARYFVTEKEADVYSGSLLHWQTMKSSQMLDSDAFDFAISSVHAENYEVTALVPKHLIGKNIFNYVSVFEPSVWTWLGISFWLYSFVLGVAKIQNRNFWRSLGKALFLFWQLTLRDGKNLRNLLVLFWTFGVSLVLNEIMQQQLLTQLTTERFAWPQSFAELWRLRRRYRFVGTAQFHLQQAHAPELVGLAQLIQPGASYNNPIAVIARMNEPGTVFLGGSNEVESLKDLFNSQKFAVLDEKYVWSQGALFVRKDFAYHQKTMQLIQRMVEAGFGDLRQRPSRVIPYILRLTNPTLMFDFMTFEDNENLEFDDIKGVFILLAFGSVLALISYLISFKKRGGVEYRLQNRPLASHRKQCFQLRYYKI